MEANKYDIMQFAGRVKRLERTFLTVLVNKALREGAIFGMDHRGLDKISSKKAPPFFLHISA